MSLAGVEETDKGRRNGTCSCYGESELDGSLKVSSYFLWKGILDRVLAMALLIAGFPLIILLIVLVRLTSKGPGVYCQTRVGKGRRIFTMYKIRTMRSGAEDRTGPVWTEIADSRITPVGRFLRKTHLDELPQLLNVAKGEMSLIGPRPERPEFVTVLTKQVPNYLKRLAVKPGITGLAQINLDPDVDVESVFAKLVLDLEYIRHATLLFDVRMLVVTLAHLLGCNADWIKRVTSLKRKVIRLSNHKNVDEDSKVTAPTASPTLPIVASHGDKIGSSLRNRRLSLHRHMSAPCATEETGLIKPR